MRLAFHHFGNDFWMAGNWFMEGMFQGLRRLGTDCPTLILVVDAHTPEADYGSLAGIVDEVLRAPELPPAPGTRVQQSVLYHMAWWLRHRLLKQPAANAPHPLARLLRLHHIDGYFTMAWNPAPIRSVPSLVWIPDFQHRRLPSNFTPEERGARDRGYAAQIGWATLVAVTSEEVCRDLETFAPDYAAKARRLRYVAPVPAEAYRDDPRATLAKYHLPEKFIYLPNQFWQHKNHQLAFEALALLGACNIRPTIVSTGNPIDYRRPAYVADLMQGLSRLDIREQFIMLGQVPRADVFQLIRQSVCVLNPSKFEGLGLSVAESISVGKRVLVSDLPALREQAAPGAVYFDPDQANDLAGKLDEAWTTFGPGPDSSMEDAARTALPRRQAAFGWAVRELFQEAQARFTL